MCVIYVKTIKGCFVFLLDLFIGTLKKAKIFPGKKFLPSFKQNVKNKNKLIVSFATLK